MREIIDKFVQITQIPHCSYEAEKLRDFLVEYGRDRNYRTEVDEANNILIYKGRPKLCLQAHYDMVCMGKAPQIETYEEDGWLKAKNSSLGADNGIAIAMMMELMDEGRELEFLLTADEEVGLIGANVLDFPLYSQYMLNLDFEDEAEVCIGCAGGADVSAARVEALVKGSAGCYEVSIKGLPGGHSGVDIDKGIPSAIKLLGEYLYKNQIDQLVSFYGGERANSIPANAVAIIRSNKDLVDSGEIKIRKLQEQPMVLPYSKELVELIATFNHGVREFNDGLGIPDSSINLAIINTDENGAVHIESSARAMSMDTLQELVVDTQELFSRFGFAYEIKDKYPAWKPESNTFTDIVSKYTKEVFGTSKTMAIHAGLECGVILEKYPNIKFASIGPTIKYPHSTREKVNINSVNDVYRVLCKIISDSELV